MVPTIQHCVKSSILKNVKTVVNLFQNFHIAKPKNKTQPINKPNHLIAEKIKEEET